MELNPLVLDSLLDVVAQLKARLPGAKDLGTGELLRWPGVLNSNSLQPEALQQLCLGQLSALLADFNATRAREGEKLADILRSRITAIETIVAHVAKLPAILSAWRCQAQQSPARGAGQCGRRPPEAGVRPVRAKIDVDEELSRLVAHLSEVKRILKQGGPGRQAAGFPDARAQPRSQHPGLEVCFYGNHAGFG